MSHCKLYVMSFTGKPRWMRNTKTNMMSTRNGLTIGKIDIRNTDIKSIDVRNAAAHVSNDIEIY